jgi:signal transduction histidine kinase
MTKEVSAVAVCEADGRIVACDAGFAELLGEWQGQRAAGLPSVARHPAGEDLWRRFAAFTVAGRDEAHLPLALGGGRERQVRLRRLSSPDGPRVLVEVSPASANATQAARESELKTLRLLHDFKNQLGGLKLYAAFLKKRFAQDADGVEVCEKIVRGLNAMAERARLVSHLARPVALTLAEADLAQVLRQAAQEVATQAAERGVRVEVASPADLPPLRLDVAQVRQAILGALRRALQATPPGQRVSLMAWAGEGEVCVEVRDAGAPLSAGQRENFFDLLAGEEAQDNSQPRELRDEIALGLALGRRIVEQHGGRVSVESLPGGGAAARFYLPSGEWGVKGGR